NDVRCKVGVGSEGAAGPVGNIGESDEVAALPGLRLKQEHIPLIRPQVPRKDKIADRLRNPFRRVWLGDTESLGSPRYEADRGERQRERSQRESKDGVRVGDHAVMESHRALPGVDRSEDLAPGHLHPGSSEVVWDEGGYPGEERIGIGLVKRW